MSYQKEHGAFSVAGQGTENLTYVLQRKDKNNVEKKYAIKFAKQLYVFPEHLLDKNNGRLVKERVKGNLEIIKNYIDKDFLADTKIKSLGNQWWIEQEFLEIEKFVNHKDIINNPQLIPKIERIFDQTEKMYRETGFCIDWFGWNKKGEGCKTLIDHEYWSIPNLVITSNGQLKIFDLGLYLDDNGTGDTVKLENREIEKHSTLSGLTDPLFCKLQLELMKKIREKINCQTQDVF